MNNEKEEEVMVSKNIPTVIVVGNSRNILKYKIGKIIDSFDIVIRLNNYHLEGYEDILGNKTSIWCTSLSQDILGYLDNNINTLKTYKKMTDVGIPKELWYRAQYYGHNDRIKTLQSGIKGLNCVERTLKFKSKGIKVFANGETMIIKRVIPTGWIAVFQAIIEYKCKIMICGFSFSDEEKKYHYYEEKNWKYALYPEDEIKIMQFCIKHNLVGFLLREDEIKFKELVYENKISNTSKGK